MREDGSNALAQREQLERFLAQSQQRAFVHARYALRDEDDALDVVQDAMLRLVRQYAQRPADEWPGLFYRIVENRIRDVQRHRSVRQRVLGWLPGRRDAHTDDEDAFAMVCDPAAIDPAREAGGDAAMTALHEALPTLPARQREAYVLRALHELSVEQAAQAMGVTLGSVKTHYSRAQAKLRVQLKEHWI